jgi:Tfp pilus assembly protein PilF
MDNQTNKKTKPWWILLPMIFSWYGIWLITPYHQGIQLANQNQWVAADEKLTLALKRDPASSITHQQLALVAAVLAEQEHLESLQTAISQLEIATQTEPSWALNYANLACLYLSDNHLEKAYQNALSAKKLAPSAARYQIISAAIAEKRNQPELAFAAYQTALDLENTWADADFWHKTPLRQQACDAWQQANPVQTISLAEAERTLAENNQSRWAYNQLAALYLQDMRVAEAETLLKTAELSYTSRPLEAIETQWLLAEVSAQQNQFAPAVQLGSQALFNYQWDGVFGPGSFGLLQYAPRVFRSSAMGLEIVPQMIDMPVPQVWVEREERVKEWEGLAQ